MKTLWNSPELQFYLVHRTLVFDDLNLVLVERHVARDMFCLILRFGVVPSQVWDAFAVDVTVIVCGVSFPRADGAGVGTSEEGLVDRVGGEVMAILDHDGLVGFCDCLSVEYYFDHFSRFVQSLRVKDVFG